MVASRSGSSCLLGLVRWLSEMNRTLFRPETRVFPRCFFFFFFFFFLVVVVVSIAPTHPPGPPPLPRSPSSLPSATSKRRASIMTYRGYYYIGPQRTIRRNPTQCQSVCSVLLSYCPIVLLSYGRRLIIVMPFSVLYVSVHETCRVVFFNKGKSVQIMHTSFKLIPREHI